MNSKPFLPIDLCKEMQEAGIVNGSGFVYPKGKKYPEYIGTIERFSDDIEAYVAEIAFLGPSETAKENSKKWAGLDRWDEMFLAWEFLKDGLNFLDPIKESVEDFLRRTRIK